MECRLLEEVEEETEEMEKAAEVEEEDRSILNWVTRSLRSFYAFPLVLTHQRVKAF